MKANAQDNPKVKSLVRWLRPQCGPVVQAETIAVGMLERLWLATAKHAPRGDIGRYSADEIAEAMGWNGDSAVLVAKLLDLRLLDQVDGVLWIHDWRDHAPTYVQGNAQKNKWWGDHPKGTPKDAPKDSPKDGPKEDPKEPPTKRSEAKRSQADPSQGVSAPPPPSCDLPNPTGREAPGSAPAARAAAAEETHGSPKPQAPFGGSTAIPHDLPLTPVAAALKAAGVRDLPTLIRLAHTPGVSVDLVRRLADKLKIDQPGGKGVGCLVKALADEAPAALEAAQKAEQAKADREARERDEAAQKAAAEAAAEASRAKADQQWQELDAETRKTLTLATAERLLNGRRQTYLALDPELASPFQRFEILETKRMLDAEMGITA